MKSLTTDSNLDINFIVNVIKHYKTSHSVNAIIMYFKGDVCIVEEGAYEFPNNTRETGFYWLNPITSVIEPHNVL